jgi:hypothetical protein
MLGNNVRVVDSERERIVFEVETNRASQAGCVEDFSTLFCLVFRRPTEKAASTDYGGWELLDKDGKPFIYVSNYPMPPFLWERMLMHCCKAVLTRPATRDGNKVTQTEWDVCLFMAEQGHRPCWSGGVRTQQCNVAKGYLTMFIGF